MRVYLLEEKNHPGRQLLQQCVFGGICWGTRKCFMYAVPERGAATLLPIIQGSVGNHKNVRSLNRLWRYAGYGIYSPICQPYV